MHCLEFFGSFRLFSERLVFHRIDREESGAGKEGNGDAGLVVDIGIFPFFLYDGAPKVRRSLKCPVGFVDGRIRSDSWESETHIDPHNEEYEREMKGVAGPNPSENRAQ